MPNKTSTEQVAIDTNVFLHLLNRAENQDSHIDHLLMHLLREGYSLCVDDQGKIAGEYKEKLRPAIDRASDTGIQRVLLSHWMRTDKIPIKVDMSGALWSAIRGVIHEADENVDRMFVAVSCIQCCALISNDNIHILSRKTELKRKTRKICSCRVKIMGSREAREYFTEL